MGSSRDNTQLPTGVNHGFVRYKALADNHRRAAKASKDCKDVAIKHNEYLVKMVAYEESPEGVRPYKQLS